MAQQQKVGTPNDAKADEWDKDLHPNREAGKNHGMAGQHPPVTSALNAFEIKELHSRMPDFSSNELKQIIVLEPGTRLQQGAKYIDLNDPVWEEFTAMANMQAGTDNYYVPKTEVAYPLWNKLIGVENPERLDQANES